MRDRSYFGTLIALCVLAVAIGIFGLACGKMEGNNINANVTASPTPTTDPCATMVDSIYGKLVKDPDIYPVVKQINISATAGAVTVTGWVNTPAIYAKVLDIVKGSSCVKSVDSSKFYGCAPGQPVQPDNLGGCGSGYVRCGDICVPDHCFWNEAPASGTTPTPVPTPSGATSCSLTPTPTPSTNSNTTPGNNTNTKSNSNSNAKY